MVTCSATAVSYQRRGPLFDLFFVSARTPESLRPQQSHSAFSLHFADPFRTTAVVSKSRFGDKLVKFLVICAHNGTAVLKGLKFDFFRSSRSMHARSCMGMFWFSSEVTPQYFLRVLYYYAHNLEWGTQQRGATTSSAAGGVDEVVVKIMRVVPRPSTPPVVQLPQLQCGWQGASSVRSLVHVLMSRTTTIYYTWTKNAVCAHFAVDDRLPGTLFMWYSSKIHYY